MQGSHTPRRRLAGLAVLAAALTACSTAEPGTPSAGATPTSAPAISAPTSPTSAAPASPTPSSGQAIPRCTTAELSGSLVGGEGAAGTVHRTLVLTNTGAGPCELTGFPGVSYVAGDDGHQVGPAAEMSGARGGPVRLTPGGSAGADVGFVQVANFDPGVCQPTAVRGLRVYPPGDTASLFVAADGTGCAGTPPGPQLTVATLAAR
jgi:hypothetical protein